jgi:membrane protein YdbS with pleckstrin-like domain
MTTEVDADGPAAPAWLGRYLKADEHDVIAVRLHPVLLARPAAVFLGGLAAAVALNGWMYAAGRAPAPAVHVIWIAWLAGALWSAASWLRWRGTMFCVTGHRVMLAELTARFGRRITMLPVQRLRDIEYTQSLMGRLLRYATFEFTSIATDHALASVRFMPRPEWMYQRACDLTMPGSTRKPVNTDTEVW